MKFGRRRPKSLGPHLKLARYLTANMPEPPASYDYSPAGAGSLRDIMGNDVLGDCVIASANHVQGLLSGNAGALVHATLDQVHAQYTAIGGWDPNNSDATDQGCDEVTALNWYCANGFANGARPLAWVYVDATNDAEVKVAGWLFEHIIYCVELPAPWVSVMPQADGYVWDMAPPVAANGHSFMSFGSDTSDNALIDSWGLYGKLTPNARRGLCTLSAGGGAYCLIDPEMVSRGQTKAPNGVAWGDIISDANTIFGGHIIAPPPVVAPTPAGTIVTADMATAWLKQAFDAAHPILDRAQAEALCASTLASRWPQPPPVIP